MKDYLLAVEEMERGGDERTLMPMVPLSSLSELGPGFMMPMAGDELELRYPAGRVVSARIVSFGVAVWKASDGAFYMQSDPAELALSLTISSDSSLDNPVAGVEVWLSEAKFAPKPDTP